MILVIGSSPPKIKRVFNIKHWTAANCDHWNISKTLCLMFNTRNARARVYNSHFEDATITIHPQPPKQMYWYSGANHEKCASLPPTQKTFPFGCMHMFANIQHTNVQHTTYKCCCCCCCHSIHSTQFNMESRRVNSLSNSSRPTVAYWEALTVLLCCTVYMFDDIVYSWRFTLGRVASRFETLKEACCVCISQPVFQSAESIALCVVRVFRVFLFCTHVAYLYISALNPSKTDGVRAALATFRWISRLN